MCTYRYTHISHLPDQQIPGVVIGEVAREGTAEQ
jgi:hypothetical protein